VTIRTVWPTAVDQTEMIAWELAPREESGEQLHRRLQNFLAFLGPAGFGIPDDVEAVESCQSTVPATEVEWQDYSRAMADDAAGEAPDNCDLQHRAFWRQWLAHLEAAPTANGAAGVSPAHGAADGDGSDGRAATAHEAAASAPNGAPADPTATPQSASVPAVGR
jgi:hypothetical protein